MIRFLIDVIAPNESARHSWVKQKLSQLTLGRRILDVGCGTQRYRDSCKHLDYFGQDFGKYVANERSVGLQNLDCNYGDLHYTGNCLDISERDQFFDAALCTEVLEHSPYPNETITEISRLIKPKGLLILTAPYACLPHMRPYFFYSGFSQEWYETILQKNKFEILEISQNGNYFRFLIQENIRCLKMIKGIPLKLIYLLISIPKVVIDFLFSKINQRDELVFDYHILARKLD